MKLWWRRVLFMLTVKVGIPLLCMEYKVGENRRTFCQGVLGKLRGNVRVLSIERAVGVVI